MNNGLLSSAAWETQHTLEPDFNELHCPSDSLVLVSPTKCISTWSSAERRKKHTVSAFTTIGLSSSTVKETRAQNLRESIPFENQDRTQRTPVPFPGLFSPEYSADLADGHLAPDITGCRIGEKGSLKRAITDHAT